LGIVKTSATAKTAAQRHRPITQPLCFIDLWPASSTNQRNDDVFVSFVLINVTEILPGRRDEKKMLLGNIAMFEHQKPHGRRPKVGCLIMSARIFCQHNSLGDLETYKACQVARVELYFFQESND
jgi:hypothetical protein